jgi:hypothetical protein
MHQYYQYQYQHCMYVCMYVRVSVCLSVCVSVRARATVCVHACVCVRARAYVCMYPSIYLCIPLSIHPYLPIPLQPIVRTSVARKLRYRLPATRLEVLTAAVRRRLYSGLQRRAVWYNSTVRLHGATTQKTDLLLRLRNQSTVLLFRSLTNLILHTDVSKLHI